MIKNCVLPPQSSIITTTHYHHTTHPDGRISSPPSWKSPQWWSLIPIISRWRTLPRRRRRRRRRRLLSSCWDAGLGHKVYVLRDVRGAGEARIQDQAQSVPDHASSRRSSYSAGGIWADAATAISVGQYQAMHGHKLPSVQASGNCVLLCLCCVLQYVVVRWSHTRPTRAPHYQLSLPHPFLSVLPSSINHGCIGCVF